MNTEPNRDLLRRQRTFSIDETREQLRQGRPVQRDAILSGAVDYRSLIFGDDGMATGSSSNTGTLPPSWPATATATNTGTVSVSVAKDVTSIDSKVVSTNAASATIATIPTAVPVPTVREIEQLPGGNTQIGNSEQVSSSVVDEGQAAQKKITPSSWAAMVKSSSAPMSDASVQFSNSSSIIRVSGGNLSSGQKPPIPPSAARLGKDGKPSTNSRDTTKSKKLSTDKRTDSHPSNPYRKTPISSNDIEVSPNVDSNAQLENVS